MRRYYLKFLIILTFIFEGINAQAQSIEKEALTHPEVVRVLGFEEYQQQKRQNNQELERGLRLHLESLEIQAREYEKARKEYRAEKRSETPPEKQLSYREHVDDRTQQRQENLVAQQEQRRIKAEERRLLRNIHLDGMRELGLPEKRPRYEIDKRALYGAEPKFSRIKEAFPGGGGYVPPAQNNFGTGNNNQDVFPPPAPFEDFPPPPTFPEGDFDLPPPPPPMEADPAMPADDFFPPPPPPPAFDDNFNF